MPIRILDAATVGRIAAGEVVERPASVAKELIENALDAGSTSVTVEIKEGGIQYLRVTDNGCGIVPGQVRLAFENHATSKLTKADELNDIRTLGFRGEALPSIAAVSRVEMTTRAKGEQTGMRLNVDGGENLRVQEAGCPEGTTLIMRDLFFNVPVRRAFLKKASYEASLVGDVVARMILGNPKISMRFINNGKTVYHSFGDGKLKHAIFAVYGRETAEKMLELDKSLGGIRIFGMIGVGDAAKPTRAGQSFFINGRSVRCALLTQTLEQVCRERVTIGMYPMCALNLVLPPTSVDVNVHPNKLEVRFRDEVATRAAVESMLRSVFEGERMLDIKRETAPVEPGSPVRRIEFIPPEDVTKKTRVCDSVLDVVDKKTKVCEQTGRLTDENSVSQSAASGNNFEKALEEEKKRLGLVGGVRNLAESAWSVFKPDRAEQQKSEKVAPDFVHETAGVRAAADNVDSRTEQPKKNYSDVAGVTKVPTEEHTSSSVKPAEPVKAEQLSVEIPVAAKAKMATSENVDELTEQTGVNDGIAYRIIGVLFKTYILVEANDALLLIDQHAAHERIRYERYVRQLEAGKASQQLLTPVILRLSLREMAILLDNIDVLNEAGYDVEVFGETDIQIRAVPLVLGKAELKPLFLDMIGALDRLKAATLDSRRGEIMQMACKGAVKAGDELSDSEVRVLVEQMLTTGAPPTCPHGRPVVKVMTKRDIEKLFKRIQ